MNFKEEILKLENDEESGNYIISLGQLPIIITAPHTIKHYKEDGTVKLNEPYTKAIARYVSNKINCSCLIKIKDTGIDSNSLGKDEFKDILLQIIKDNHIKLLIDLHGASGDRDFDVEFGTLNNVSIDFSAIRELEDAFKENGIFNIEYNSPFKGGGITQYIYEQTNIDIVQIEINRKYRDLNNYENIEKICNALIDYFKMYTNFIDRIDE